MKFVPYEKLSKKRRRALDLSRRGDLGRPQPRHAQSGKPEGL